MTHKYFHFAWTFHWVKNKYFLLYFTSTINKQSILTINYAKHNQLFKYLKFCIFTRSFQSDLLSEEIRDHRSTALKNWQKWNINIKKSKLRMLLQLRQMFSVCTPRAKLQSVSLLMVGGFCTTCSQWALPIGSAETREHIAIEKQLWRDLFFARMLITYNDPKKYLDA